MRGTMLTLTVLAFCFHGEAALAINHNGFLGFGQGGNPQACYGGQVMQVTSCTDRGPNWFVRMLDDCKETLRSLCSPQQPEMNYCMPMQYDMQPMADPCFTCVPEEQPGLWRRLCNALGLGPRDNTEIAACMPLEMYAGSPVMDETFSAPTFSTPTYSNTPMMTVPTTNTPVMNAPTMVSPTPSGSTFQYEEIPNLRPMPGPVPGAWRQSPHREPSIMR